MGLLDWLRKLFAPRPAAVIVPRPSETSIYSELPIELVISPVSVSTCMLVYEGDKVDLPGYIWFRITYAKEGPSDILAISMHPRGGFTSAFPYSFTYWVEIPELSLEGTGSYKRFYDEKAKEVVEVQECPSFVIPKVFSDEEVKGPEPLSPNIPPIHPKSYAVNVRWEEFTIPSVYYPPLVGGDGKFHPAIIRAGKYERLQMINILPAKCKPWYRK